MIGRLTLRDERRALDIAIAVAIVSVAIALAGLVWRIAGHAGTGAVTVPDAPAAPPAGAAPAPLAWMPFGSPAAVDATQPTGIQAVLKGVVFARPDTLSTAFVAIGSEPPRPVRVGEAVAGAQVTEIRRDRIILNNGGRLEYLAFPDPFATAANGAAPPGAPPPAGTPPGAPPQPAPAPPPVAAPAGPSAQTILSRLNATPVADGYAIGAGAPPGFRQGDVVQSVNGARMTDQNAVNAAVAAAGQAGQAQVTLLRDGRPITVTVPIR